MDTALALDVISREADEGQLRDKLPRQVDGFWFHTRDEIPEVRPDYSATGALLPTSLASAQGPRVSI